MRWIAGVLLLVLTLVLPAPRAEAQADGCPPGYLPQADMAGVYVSMESTMRITIWPCGGVEVFWSNEYGTHRAYYLHEAEFEGGGFIARIYQPDPYVGSLDGRNVVAVKPAEPGYVQALTVGPFVDNVKIYRLQKIA
jgi:hypothetical protein